MDLNARVDVNCGRKDGRTENRTPISHLAKAGATKMSLVLKIDPNCTAVPSTYSPHCNI